MSMGGHAELDTPVTPYNLRLLRKLARGGAGKDKRYEKDKLNTLCGKVERRKMRICFQAHIDIHILSYTGYSIRPLEPSGYR